MNECDIWLERASSDGRWGGRRVERRRMSVFLVNKCTVWIEKTDVLRSVKDSYLELWTTVLMIKLTARWRRSTGNDEGTATPCAPPRSVATCYLKSSVAFVHALYYFARLRPLQPLTGRRRRRYSNSTFKSDFPLHNNSVQRLPLYSSFVKNPLICCFLCCPHNPQNLSQPFHLKCISSFLLSVQLYLFLSNINWIYILNNYRLLQCYIHTYVLMLSYIT